MEFLAARSERDTEIVSVGCVCPFVFARIVWADGATKKNNFFAASLMYISIQYSVQGVYLCCLRDPNQEESCAKPNLKFATVKQKSTFPFPFLVLLFFYFYSECFIYEFFINEKRFKSYIV